MNRFKVKEDTLHEYYISIIEQEDVDIIETKLKNYAKFGEVKRIQILNEFRELYPDIELDNLIVYGKTDEVTTHLLSKFIESKDLVHKLGEGKEVVTRAYKCFNNSLVDFKVGMNAIHEDRLSSWRCLMERLKFPEFVMVYKIDKNGKK